MGMPFFLIALIQKCEPLEWKEEMWPESQTRTKRTRRSENKLFDGDIFSIILAEQLAQVTKHISHISPRDKSSGNN